MKIDPESEDRTNGSSSSENVIRAAVCGNNDHNGKKGDVNVGDENRRHSSGISSSKETNDSKDVPHQDGSKMIEEKSNESIIQINQSASNLNQLLHELEMENKIREENKETDQEKKEAGSEEEKSNTDKLSFQNEASSKTKINHQELDEEPSPGTLKIAEEDDGEEDGRVNVSNEILDQVDVAKTKEEPNDGKNDVTDDQTKSDHNDDDDDVNQVDDELTEKNVEKIEEGLEAEESENNERIMNGSEGKIDEKQKEVMEEKSSI